MKFGFQSLVSAGLLGFAVLLQVSAAPVASELNLRTNAVLDLGLRAGGLVGEMVERDEIDDAWHYARAEVPDDELYARSWEEDSGIAARWEYLDTALYARNTEDHVNAFAARAEYPLDARGPSLGDGELLVARSKVGNFFKKIWGGIKKVASNILRRDVDQALPERS